MMGWVERIQAQTVAAVSTSRTAKQIRRSAPTPDKDGAIPVPQWVRETDSRWKDGELDAPTGVSKGQVKALGDWAKQALEAGDKGDPPPGVSEEDWAKTPASVRLMTASAARFGLSARDEKYSTEGGASFDDFNYDVNAVVDDYEYRHTLLRMDENSVRGNRAVPARRGGGAIQARTSKGMTTVQDLMVKTKNMGADELEGFQRDLYAAGFYGSVGGERDSEPLWGAPDEPTLAAVKLLGYHTLSFKGKYSIVEMLDVFRRAADRDGDGTPDSEAKSKPKVRLTNPLDVQMAAQDQSVELMGRRLGNDEAAGIAGGYNGLEAAAGAAAGDGTGGGTFTDAPGVLSFTENELRGDYGAEIDAYGYLQTFNDLLAELGVRG